MPTINQYRSKLEKVLVDQLDVRRTIPTRPIREVAVTAPFYTDSLITTYGLSQPELDNCVYRIGIGRKLSKEDSDIYDEYGDLIERPTVDERGILCPQGILMFYEDVLYRHGRDVNILAASYHFQTAPQSGRYPLYVRFEFDPIITDPPKPIFHYHFSNYHLFHKRCHFPAGHFEVPDCYPFAHKDLQQRFKPHTVPDLETFLQLLISAGLVTKR